MPENIVIFKAQYLQKATHPRLGMRPLAILYSLPYAYLMWAMVSFIGAILLYVFQSGVSVSSQAIISAIAAGMSKFAVMECLRPMNRC